jgi:amidophosphoribosyltransferase
VGRTFIQPSSTRGRSAKGKYTPLPAVLKGKRVFLVEDSIVRSTTLVTLADQIRHRGGAREVHVRVACPPIVAPCFYGIDMSTMGELFAPRHILPRHSRPGHNGYNGSPDKATLARMAKALKIDSLRYLTVGDLGPCLQLPQNSLCMGCVTGAYPSKWGNHLMKLACRNLSIGKGGRTYETSPCQAGRVAPAQKTT